MTSHAHDELDLRGLAPPQPLERILSEINIRPPASQFAVILIHEPFPLYDLLAMRGCSWQGEAIAGGYRLLITLPPAF